MFSPISLKPVEISISIVSFFLKFYPCKISVKGPLNHTNKNATLIMMLPCWTISQLQNKLLFWGYIQLLNLLRENLHLLALPFLSILLAFYTPSCTFIFHPYWTSSSSLQASPLHAISFYAYPWSSKFLFLSSKFWLFPIPW